MRVSASSVPNQLAGAIAGVIRSGNNLTLRAVGASATNQATKAIAIAAGYLEKDGIEIACLPRFVDIDIDGQTKTAIETDIWGKRGDPRLN